MQENTPPNNQKSTSFLQKTPQRENKILSFLNIGRPRQTPGVANTDLSSLVKEYNMKLLSTHTSHDSPRKKNNESPKKDGPKMKEHPGEKYFPSAFENSEIDLKSSGGVFIMLDDETMIEWENGIDEIYLTFRIMTNTMTGAVSVTKVHSGLRDENGFYNFMDFGKKDQVRSEVVKNGIFNSLKKHIVEQPKEKALDFNFVYRPGEVKYYGEPHPNFNKFEIKGKIAPIKLDYKHMFLTHLLALYESFQLDRAYRENLDMNYVQKLEMKRKSMMTCKDKFFKKQRQVAQSAALKKFVLTKKIVKSFIKLQSELRTNLKKMDAKILPISFEYLIEVGGLNLAFYDGKQQPSAEIFLQKGNIEVIKTEDFIKASAWGMGASARDTMENLYDYFSGISSIVGDKLKELKATIESVKIYE